MMLLSGLLFLIGAVLIVVGLILSTDGVDSWHRRRARATDLPAGVHRTERVTDEVVVRRCITKERIT